jgi:DNA-directed RNA polymerase subunit K/omega
VYTQALAFLSPAVIPTTLLTKATPGGFVDKTGTAVGNSFEFVVLASLRVRQLVDGCTPRVEGEGKKTTIAKREVLAGKVANIAAVIPG